MTSAARTARREGTRLVPARAREAAAAGTRLVTEHELLNSANAIAFRVLIALIPLTLLGLALLGATGQQRAWDGTIGPAVEGRVSAPVYDGIDASAQRILHGSGAGLIALAVVLAIWDVSGAVRVCMAALNRIGGCRETRSRTRRLAVSIAIAGGLSLAIVGALLALMAAPNVVRHGAAHWLVAIGRWPVAVVLLGAGIGLLVRFAPARNRRTPRATVGSVLVVGAWIVTTFGFKLYVEYAASFRSGPGILVAFLVLTTYVYASSIVFLAGVELDEQLPDDLGALDVLRALKR